MANYSSDSDLALYERDITRFGTLTSFHTAAKTEIDRRLKKDPRVVAYMDGESKTDPADVLSTDTKADLKVVSCYYVLYLAYNSVSISAMDDYADKAKHYYAMFERQMGDTKMEIETDGDTDEEATLRTGEVTL